MGDSTNAFLVRVEFDINKPRVAEIYYSSNSKIDENNRTRQDDLQLKRKLQNKDWDIRVNTSILGMNDVDTYCTGNACNWWDERNPAEFYYNPAEEIIENRWTERRTRRKQAGKTIYYPGYIRNVFPHCNPTKKKRKIKTPDSFKDTKFLAQSRYKVYRTKTTYFCSNCGD